MMKLNELPVGGRGIIHRVGGTGNLRLRLLDMGLTSKTEVAVTRVAPMGDPIELTLRGYQLTIRREDAANVEVDPV